MIDTFKRSIKTRCVAAVCVIAMSGVASPVVAQVTAFKQAIAESVSDDEVLSSFYRSTGFEPLWSGEDAMGRRQALLAAFDRASDHGLPARLYDAAEVEAQIRNATDPRAQGQMEVELTRLFLQYARDVQTGVVTPQRADRGIKREPLTRDWAAILMEFADANPASYIRSLPPQNPEYTRLMREKLRLERQIMNGGWGATVPNGRLERGSTGAAVVALRDRLIATGYLDRTATQTYTDDIEAAVQRFQREHGLLVDGVVGESTLVQLNVAPEERLRSIVVAMERERWLNRDRGARHVWVNLTDFSARIIDNDEITFETRSVIGANYDDRESPEFSDSMEYMVINPSWYVPRSIATREYLPQLQRNRNAVSHLEITDRSGRRINRANVNWNAYTASTFPFSMREPPNPNNALGLVKFIFPNRWNIYLHDTPAQELFSREVRAFSHGCIRLNDPYDFAYMLLARQEADPEGYFQSVLATGNERRVNLDEEVPVHIVYRTAFTDARGTMNYRADVYGRDGRIWNALAGEGVVLRGLEG